MAQGSTKLAKKQKSAGAAKKKVVKTKAATKGPKERRHKNNPARADDIATTKAINRKNEAGIAAKAVAVGTQFFLTDIATKGKTDLNKKLNERNKKQGKATGAADRLKVQLRKLGRDV
jgi:hypothetical protein